MIRTVQSHSRTSIRSGILPCSGNGWSDRVSPGGSGRSCPSSRRRSSFHRISPPLVMADGVPVGFLCWQRPSRDELEAAALADLVDIDILIAEVDALDRGIGPAALVLPLAHPGADYAVRYAGVGPSGFQRTCGPGGQESRLPTVARVHRSGPGAVPIHARGSARCRPVRAAAEQRLRRIPLTRARRYIASMPQRESAASRDSGLSARIRRGLSGHVPAACP